MQTLRVTQSSYFLQYTILSGVVFILSFQPRDSTLIANSWVTYRQPGALSSSKGRFQFRFKTNFQAYGSEGTGKSWLDGAESIYEYKQIQTA